MNKVPSFLFLRLQWMATRDIMVFAEIYNIRQKEGLPMKRIAVLLLVICLLSLCLASCYMDESSKYAQIQGTWLSEQHMDENTKLQILENIVCCEEGIAVCSDIPLSYYDAFDFKMDRTYQMYCDAIRTKAQIQEYCENVIDTLYRERSSLVSIFGDGVQEMNDSEFFEAYASLYNLQSKDELVTFFVEALYDYDKMAETVEEGTYWMANHRIYFKDSAENSETHYTSYEIDSDGQLILQYSDGPRTFFRPN